MAAETVAGTIRSMACPGQHKVKAAERVIPDEENVLHDHDVVVITCDEDVIGDFDFGRRTRLDRSNEIRLVVQQTLMKHDFEIMACLLAELMVAHVLPANGGPERDDFLRRILFITSKFDDSEEEPMPNEMSRETVPPLTGVSAPGADVNVGETAAEVEETEEETEDTDPAEGE